MRTSFLQGERFCSLPYPLNCIDARAELIASQNRRTRIEFQTGANMQLLCKSRVFILVVLALSSAFAKEFRLPAVRPEPFSFGRGLYRDQVLPEAEYLRS